MDKELLEMNHKGTLNIETERLLLRKFRLDDAEMMYNNWANDERVTKFLSWTPYKSMEDVRKYISSSIESYQQDTIYHWAIVFNEKVVGSISVMSIDEKNKLCELGYCVGYEYWGRGIVTEAMKSVISFLFNEVQFHRIFAKHDVENPASGKVMEKCNMIYEGTLHGHYRRHDGTYSDSRVFGIVVDNQISFSCL